MIHACGSSSASQQRQFSDARLRSTFNMIAMDSSYCGWTTGAERRAFITIEEAAENFLLALDRLYGERRLRFGILAEGFFGSNCASYMAVSFLFGRRERRWRRWRWLTRPADPSQHKRPEQVQSIVLASPGWMRE